MIATLLSERAMARATPSPAAFVEARKGAPGRHRDDTKRRVVVHVAHGDEGPVFERQRRHFMRQRLDAIGGGFLGDEAAELDIAAIGIFEVLDEMREFVAREDALVHGIVVDVIAGVDQPMGVENDDRVSAGLACAPAELPQPLDRRGTASMGGTWPFRDQHRRHMRGLGREDDLSHGFPPPTISL